MRSPTTQHSSTKAPKTTPCCTKVGLKRGPWTPEEDELLANYINKEGEGRWRTLPKRAGLLRCGKSCRLRWMNYLRPSVKRGQIAPDEEDLILRLHRLLGNRWSLIAGRIPGRTDNEIKNYWNTHLSKKLISQGIDPRTHKPLNLDRSEMNTTKASSSRTNNGKSSNATTKQNNNNAPVSSSGVEETTSGSSTQVNNNNNDNDDNNDKNESNKENIKDYHTSLLMNSDRFGMNVINHQGPSSNTDGDDHEDMSYCNEDVFSSFLNSLINEDPLINSQNHHIPMQQQLPNGIESLGTGLGSGPMGFGSLGAGWESAILSFTHSQNDPRRGRDHHHHNVE